MAGAIRHDSDGTTHRQRSAMVDRQLGRVGGGGRHVAGVGRWRAEVERKVGSRKRLPSDANQMMDQINSVTCAGCFTESET